MVGLVARPGWPSGSGPGAAHRHPEPRCPDDRRGDPDDGDPDDGDPGRPAATHLAAARADADRGCGPPEPLAGNWLSLDRTFETLHLYSDGTYRWEDPPTADKTGRYQVDGSQLTFTGGAADQAFTWSVRDALLTLTDDTGARRLYTRN